MYLLSSYNLLHVLAGNKLLIKRLIHPTNKVCFKWQHSFVINLVGKNITKTLTSTKRKDTISKFC